MAPKAEFTFTAEVWEHQGQAAWHFVSLPEDVADDIEGDFGHKAAGFGSVKVQVTIGSSSWSTSLFPDNKRGTYILPIKKPVRVAEDLAEGSRPTITVEVLI